MSEWRVHWLTAEELKPKKIGLFKRLYLRWKFRKYTFHAPNTPVEE